jgi:hypothetical protein
MACMAELIPYTALPIPRPGSTLEEIGPQVEAVRRLEIPGIIIPDVDPDTSVAMAMLRPVLAACGITIIRSEPPIENQGGKRDQPMHIDAIPIDHPSTGMVVQNTKLGSADIVLAKLADPFCKELSERNAHIALGDHKNANYDLPLDTEAQFNEGLVDPDVLRPEVFVGSVTAGSTIAFTFSGVNPIAHRFRSTSPERHLQAHIASFTRLD